MSQPIMPVHAADSLAGQTQLLATFACGCFWSKEYHFAQITGVLTTQVGFTGGTTSQPTYTEVCHKQTGHAEAVRLLYDPEQVTYVELLAQFFAMHDATIDRRDKGGQYRSAIFHHSPQQKEQAQAALATLQQAGLAVTTQLAVAGPFYPAAARHQQYCLTHNRSPRGDYGLSLEQSRALLDKA